MFTGWNTISLPFDLTAEQVNETFGNDCKLEALSNAKADGDNVYLTFQNSKSKGIKANTPYILYYTKESGNVKIATEATVKASQSEEVFNAGGNTIKFIGADKITTGDNIYGIYAADNSESKFQHIDNSKTGCYATRCYITTSNSNAKLVSLHEDNETTAINNINANEDSNTSIFGINGAKKSAVSHGVNIVNKKKVLVK